MVDINSSIPIITLNTFGLNDQNKRPDIVRLHKKNIKLFL